MSNDIIDNPLRVCSVCQKAVISCFKLFHKATANGDTTKKRRKYTDETGRLWHGTKCPDCAAKWRKDRAALSEAAKQADLKKQIEG